MSVRNASVRRSTATLLSPLMLVTMTLTVVAGLPLDRFAGIPGQIAVSAWTWMLFLMLLRGINQELRLPLLLCLVISTLGECFFSLVWGLYTYWLNNIPLFVPPGHVLLFALGLTIAPRVPRWAVMLVAAFAAVYGMSAYLTATDTFSVALAILFLLFIAFGRNRQLYATMFVISLVMELYGTWIGNWIWVAHVPGLPLTSANPPLCVGGLYCALDLCVVAMNRYLGKVRPASSGAQASPAA
jgi:hypothetical protein